MCKKTNENGDCILLVITGNIYKICNLSLMLDKPQNGQYKFPEWFKSKPSSSENTSENS